MNETIEKQNNFQSNSFRRMYIIAAVFIPLLIFAALFYIAFTHEPKSEQASEKIIREVVAAILSKKLNNLNNDDFLKVTALHLNGKRLSDIKLLAKFRNLEVLDLSGINFPTIKIPKWKVVLGKWGIINLPKIPVYDLSPLKKLSNLRILILSTTPVNNIEPLATLTNLKTLKINGTDVYDLEPIKVLLNIESLDLSNTQISTLESISELTNLRELEIYGTNISYLEPIKKMTNLRRLVISYDKFSDEQLEYFKKALLDLNIIKSDGRLTTLYLNYSN